MENCSCLQSLPVTIRRRRKLVIALGRKLRDLGAAAEGCSRHADGQPSFDSLGNSPYLWEHFPGHPLLEQGEGGWLWPVIRWFPLFSPPPGLPHGVVECFLTYMMFKKMIKEAVHKQLLRKSAVAQNWVGHKRWLWDTRCFNKIQFGMKGCLIILIWLTLRA